MCSLLPGLRLARYCSVWPQLTERMSLTHTTAVPCADKFCPPHACLPQPAWNLEHGCSNICQLALEAADKRGALYTTEGVWRPCVCVCVCVSYPILTMMMHAFRPGVHFKDLDSVAVCNRCELASRKVFNEQRRQSMEKKTKVGRTGVVWVAWQQACSSTK